MVDPKSSLFPQKSKGAPSGAPQYSSNGAERQYIVFSGDAWWPRVNAQVGTAVPWLAWANGDQILLDPRIEDCR